MSLSIPLMLSLALILTIAGLVVGNGKLPRSAAL